MSHHVVSVTATVTVTVTVDSVFLCLGELFDWRCHGRSFGAWVFRGWGLGTYKQSLSIRFSGVVMWHRRCLAWFHFVECI